MYEQCKQNQDGQVACYSNLVRFALSSFNFKSKLFYFLVPQLARYSSENWALSICTVDGQRYSLGNVDTPFTMQSCSKPFTYGICMNELGSEVVHR